MNLILNTNKLGYKPFLSSKIDTFIIGLKDFCINQNYEVSLKKLSVIINDINKSNKKIYLSLNIFAKESKIKKLESSINKLQKLNIDGFIVSDLGVANIFKKLGLESKVILDLQTYVTNKYSAKALLDLGIKGLFISREITLNDIKEISNFNKNKIFVLAQGFVPITYSYRSILNCYYKKHKIKNKTDIHYIKEENRDNYYYLTQKNNSLTVFNDKQYSLLPYLFDLANNNIENIEIDSNFLSLEETNEYISFYSKAIQYIKNNDYKEFEKLAETFININEFDNPFLHSESILLKEGK